MEPKSPMTPALAPTPDERSHEGQRCLNHANQLVGREHLHEGAALYRRAAELVPSWHLPHFNLGAVLLRLGHDEVAREAFERAVTRKPDCWKSQFNLALLHLRHGRFVEGWNKYDWRFRAGGQPAARFGRPAPVWDGRRLSGETLLLCAEQGAGDLIQFCRFVPSVAARGARVLLECPPSLMRLMKNIDGVEGLVDPTARCPEADLQFPLMSVPRILGDHFHPCPVPTPYLTAPDEIDPELERRLADEETLNIGVVWTGDPGNPHNPVRSCRLEDLRPLTEVDGVRLFSLQYHDAGLSASELTEHGVTSLGSALGDFASAAALMERMDLIVTVDTAAAHLAGALARPAWVLLSRPADWRWLVAGSKTPWYPSLRLFRQTSPDDWTSVIEAMVAELDRSWPKRPTRSQTW